MRSTTFAKLLNHKRGKDGAELTFLDEKGQTQSCFIADAVIGDVLEALQRSVLLKGQERDFLTVTVLGSQPLMTPVAKGLALQTREAGTIAFAVPDVVIPRLQGDLAALATARPPSRKQ